MHLRPILKGLKTFLPLPSPCSTTRGTDNARYCYSVWMRHLFMANTIPGFQFPEVVAELGPGDSLGIGMAALLSGAKTYFGLDVVDYTSRDRNLAVLEELVELVKQQADIPDDAEFPNVQPKLPDYGFPRQAFLAPPTIDDAFLTQLRNELMHSPSSGRKTIHFTCPWDDPALIRPESVDLVFSQATLEHVDQVLHTYMALYSWLKPGSLMTHVVDFTSHSITPEWNGHWAYPGWVFRLVRGKRPYLINREPLSAHLKILEASGFELLLVLPNLDETGLKRNQLSREFKGLTEQDIITKTAFFIARKRT